MRVRLTSSLSHSLTPLTQPTCLCHASEKRRGPFRIECSTYLDREAIDMLQARPSCWAESVVVVAFVAVIVAAAVVVAEEDS